MKIVICGSMKFSKEMVEVKRQLSKLGHEVVLPKNTESIAEVKEGEAGEHLSRKIANDSIRAHYEEIKQSDAVLVLNYNKNGIKNYIGANTFLEMGYAHCLNKKIYVLNNLPNQKYINDELHAFNSTILNSKLTIL